MRIVVGFGDARTQPKYTLFRASSGPAVKVRPALSEVYSQVEPRVAPRGAVPERPYAKPPITHSTMRWLEVETAGTAKLSPTDSHGGVHGTHSPELFNWALPVVPRSLPSTSQPWEPEKTIAPDRGPPPAGVERANYLDQRANSPQ